MAAKRGGGHERTDVYLIGRRETEELRLKRALADPTTVALSSLYFRPVGRVPA